MAGSVDLGSMLAVASGIGTPVAVAWFAARSKLSETGLTAQTAFIAGLQKTIDTLEAQLKARSADVASEKARADVAEARSEETEDRMLAQKAAHREEVSRLLDAHHAAQTAWQRERHAVKNELTSARLEIADWRFRHPGEVESSL